MGNSFEIINKGRSVLENEASSLQKTAFLLDDHFASVVSLLLQQSGRLVISGVGKSALVAQKMVATLNSTGTPSVFMHAADAVHGDLGMLQPEDSLMLISQSGETAEILYLLQFIAPHQPLIAMTGNPDSRLGKRAQFVLNSWVERESCPNNLAPTNSSLVQMALGDALAVCLMEARSFQKDDFARFHPAGALGKRLYLTIEQIAARNNFPHVTAETNIQDSIVAISEGRMGAVAIVDQQQQLLGILTDGDLRRLMLQGFTNDLQIGTIMTPNPKTAEVGTLAVEVLQKMKEVSINQIIVCNKQLQAVGMVHLQDLLKEGL